MKIYVDLSCDKISGQQIMQRKFKTYCADVNVLSSKEDADVLVFVQVPQDQNIEEWREYKRQGKKIVFIHHYLVKEIIDAVAIFNIPGLLEFVDLHIIMSQYGDILKELNHRHIFNDKIVTIEQAGVDRRAIEMRFFSRARNEKTICYVGRARKGLDRFVNLTKDMSDWHRSIFCPDVQKYDGDLSKYHVFTNLTNWELFDMISRHQFMYSPSVYLQPRYHLETSIHEAVHCGTAVVVDEEFCITMPRYILQGFIAKDEFINMSNNERIARVSSCSNYLYQNYDDADTIMRKNLKAIKSICEVKS